MKSKFILKPLCFLICLFSASLAIAQKPFSEPIEGQVASIFGGTIGDCKASSITCKYRLSTLVGEPTIFTNMKWENAYGTAVDCISEGDFEIFIYVTVFGQYTDYWIPAQGSFGLVPKGTNTWGENPLSGSPNWDELFLKSAPTKAFQNSGREFITSDLAKSIWKSGYLRVKGILLVDKNGNKTNVH